MRHFRCSPLAILRVIRRKSAGSGRRRQLPGTPRRLRRQQQMNMGGRPYIRVGRATAQLRVLLRPAEIPQLAILGKKQRFPIVAPLNQV
jgi:hypothetical protein